MNPIPPDEDVGGIVKPDWPYLEVMIVLLVVVCAVALLLITR